jgi:arylsulfatase A-like enzyme
MNETSMNQMWGGLLRPCVTAAMLAILAPGLHAAGPARPNIILILADDLGLGDIGCYGQQHFATPNIDRLAEGGLRFTQHYSGNTVCAPSRCALMTGLHTGHTAIRGNLEVNPEGQHPLPAGTPTVAKLLKGAGYTTGAFGKWGLGYPGSEGEPLKQGFDRFFGYNCQRLAHHYYPRHLWDDNRKLELPANAGHGKGVYAPELIHAQTLAFLEANQDRPFFCYVASIIPHAELAAPERYMARHRNRYGPEEPYKGLDDGPAYRQGQYESQPEPRAAYAAMINLLDDQVGEIVAKVGQLGLAEQTLILFASDNGPEVVGGADPGYFGSSGGLRGIKRDLYEGGIRVPLIASWPGAIAAGRTTAHLSAFWDLLPTLAELAGRSVPAGLDGISFAPTLLGVGTQAQHDYLYWEFHECGGRSALRQGDWKVVRYDVAKNPGGPLALYHLGDDPAEQADLAAKFPDRVRQMGALLGAARTESPLFKFSQNGFSAEQ